MTNQLNRLTDDQRPVMEDYFHSPTQDLGAYAPNFGHMAYLRQIITVPHGARVFAKILLPSNYHDDAGGTAADYAAHDLELLDHEAASLQLVNQAADSLAPQLLLYQNGVMLTEYLLNNHWSAPKPADLPSYLRDAMQTLDNLQSLPISDQLNRQTIDSLRSRNWPQIDFAKLPFPEAEKLTRFRDIGAAVIQDLACIVPVHHDAHQNNIGWRPGQGARLVDFSWLSLGPENSDQTSFLIDLATSGYDVTPWLDGNFNPSYAWLRAGNWLYRSSLPPDGPDGFATRRAQFNSAVTALKLLGVSK